MNEPEAQTQPVKQHQQIYLFNSLTLYRRATPILSEIFWDQQILKENNREIHNAIMKRILTNACKD